MAGINKSGIWAIAKALTKFAFNVSAFYAAFRFVFDFGNSQALGLGLALSIAIDAASSKKPPQQASFTRHRLSIRFHLYPMLMDLGLIDGDEQWKSIIGDAPSVRVWEPNSVYHYWISAYVIATDPDLFHFPVLQSYSESWEFDIKLDGIEKAGSWMAWSPEVFIKPGHGSGLGYHIGIRVNEEWWETAKPSIGSGVVLFEDKEWNLGCVRLTLAILPYDVIYTYYRETGRPSSHCEGTCRKGWMEEH